MKSNTQFPLPVRLSKAQATVLETTTRQAIETSPHFTMTLQLEAMIADFVVRMSSTRIISPATADRGTVCVVEKTLAKLLELLDAAQRNDWPIHTTKRSPVEDTPHLEALRGRAAFLFGEVAKAHAIIDGTKRALRWIAFNDLENLEVAVNAIAAGTSSMADTDVIKTFAAGIGLDVQISKPASWSKPDRFTLQRSYILSATARTHIASIVDGYMLGSESAAIRMVLDCHGKPIPTILKPALTEALHEVDLEFINRWTYNAAIALKNGRTPAVPVAIDLTAIFDSTLKDVFAVREKIQSAALHSTKVTAYHFAALRKWCEGRHSIGDLVSMLGLFKTLGVFSGNPTDVTKLAAVKI